MRILIQLALVDNQLSPPEKRMIFNLGAAHNISEEDLEEMFAELLRAKEHQIPALENLSEDDRFDYLYHLIQLMKVDKKVYLSEIRFCEGLAVRLGYKKQVIGALSSKIFGDTTVGVKKETLLAITKKYKLI